MLRRYWSYLLVPLTLAVVLALWQFFVEAKNFPDFFLPTPTRIAERFIGAWASGDLVKHGSITLSESVAGFVIALLFSSVVGYAIAKSRLLERIIAPYLVASQTVPVIALAPLILVWLGTGFLSNVLVAALVCFFPMLVNTVTGIRNVHFEYRRLMLSYAATRGEIFFKLELPAALPVFFAGARVGATLAVIGVTVIELFWGDRGLGFLLNRARGTFDTPLLFVALLSLSAIALVLYGVIALFEWLLVKRPRGLG
jgi:NitT/TauT family transport system permease protein